MKGRKALLLGLGSGAAGLAVAILFLPAVRHRLEEEWCLRKLDSSDRIERRRAGERLAELRSERAIPKLVKLFPAGEVDWPPLWVVQSLLRMGQPGIDAAFQLELPDGRLHPGVFEAIEELGPGMTGAIPALVARLGSEEDGEKAVLTIAALGPAAVPALARALSQGNAVARANAAEALGRIGESSAATLGLAGALRDRELRVRENAASALRQIGAAARGAVPALIAMLADEEPEVSAAAAEALGSIGPDAGEAIPALLELLGTRRDPDFSAVKALAAIDPDLGRVGPLLLGRLRDLSASDVSEAWSFLWALRIFAGRLPEVARALLAKTHDADPDQRRQAARALSELGTEEVRRRLLDLLRDQAREVRLQAAFSLASQQVFPDETVPLLVEALQDPNGSRRRTAAGYFKALGSRASPAVPALIASLKDNSMADISIWALYAAKDATEDHLSEVAALFTDPRPEVCELAFRVLRWFGPRAAAVVPDLVKALNSAGGKKEMILIEAIGAIGPAAKEAVPALISRLRSAGGESSDSVRGHAIAALGEIGPEAVPALLAALGDPLPVVRESAAYALGRIPAASAASLPALLRTLGDPSPPVRCAAASSLGEVGKGAAGAIPTLRPLLRDPDPEARLAAADALRALGEKAGQFLDVLIALLDDSDPWTRARAAWSIGEIGAGASPAVPALTRVLKDDHFAVVEGAVAALKQIGAGARPALSALRELADSLPGSRLTPSVEEAIAEIGK